MSNHSHYHCWDQNQPSACGQKLEDHKQCCLCSKIYKAKIPIKCECEKEDRQEVGWEKGILKLAKEYANQSYLVSEESYQRLKDKRKRSGLSWNLFMVELLKRK